MRRSSIGVFGVALLSLMASALPVENVIGCQVPVFRYALERWNPDRYQVLVLSKGPLSAEMSKWIEPLKADDLTAPIELQVIDVSANDDPVAQQLWAEHSNDDTPAIVVTLYPKRFGQSHQPASVGVLSEGLVQGLLDSPARKEIIKRLTEGHSAVWILLKSGESSKDALALQRLEQQLAKDAERLELPTPEELEVDDNVLAETKVPLQIKFSVVGIDRTDPAEKFLIECLLGSESDLGDYGDEPIAFPVFGRGIALYAIVGSGISGEIIGSASKFIVGPCSCQVKEQNPGFDLLLDCDWDAVIGNALISSPLPSLDAPPHLLTIPPGKTKK